MRRRRRRTATHEEIIAAVESMTVLELADLVKAMEEKFGVSAAAPVVVGGGVKARDLPALRKTGVDGFFVVSAVAGADDPAAAARELVKTWQSAPRS